MVNCVALVRSIKSAAQYFLSSILEIKLFKTVVVAEVALCLALKTD